MDILAHTLWANAGARGVNALCEKKGKKFHMHAGWTAFWGVIPDFFAFTIPFVILLFKIIFGDAGFGFPGHHTQINGIDIASYLYQFSHSVVIFALVFILASILSRKVCWPMLGWLLHIIIDVPSHSVEFYPTPFLFPISEYRFPYGVSWAHPTYMVINYSMLLLTWSYIFYKKLFKSQKYREEGKGL